MHLAWKLANEVTWRGFTVELVDSYRRHTCAISFPTWKKAAPTFVDLQLSKNLISCFCSHRKQGNRFTIEGKCGVLPSLAAIAYLKNMCSKKYWAVVFKLVLFLSALVDFWHSFQTILTTILFPLRPPPIVRYCACCLGYATVARQQNPLSKVQRISTNVKCMACLEINWAELTRSQIKHEIKD